jgi:hypothetical protein
MNRNNIILLIIIGLWIFYHIITISISPLPNFDEVFFTSIADNYSNDFTFSTSIGSLPGQKTSEVLVYGPLYFMALGNIIKYFGLNIFVGRSISLFSGFLLLFFFIFFLKKTSKKTFFIYLFVLLFITDSRIFTSMHSGRMDLFCIVFFLMAIYIIWNFDNFFMSSIAGILLAISYLITPRIIFYFLGLLVIFSLDFFYYKLKYKKYFIAFFVFLFFVSFWIIFKFNSPTNYINYIKNLKNFGYNDNSSTLGYHFGINNISFFLKNPAFIIFVIVSFFSYYFNLFTRLTLFVFSIIVSHLFFIHEAGPYSAMILPFVYWFIINQILVLSNSINYRRYLFLSIYILLAFNVSTFLFKSFVLLSSYNSRNEYYVTESLSPFNLNNKNVLSSFKFYYILKNKQANFTSIELVKDDLSKSEISQFNFLIVDTGTYKKLSLKYNFLFKKVVLIKSPKSYLYSLDNLLNKYFNIYLNYDGYFIVL